MYSQLRTTTLISALLLRIISSTIGVGILLFHAPPPVILAASTPNLSTIPSPAHPPAAWTELWSAAFPQAVELYDQAQFDQAAQTLFMASKTLLAQPRERRLTRWLSSQNPQAVAAYQLLGNLAYKNNQLNVALFYYLRALNINPHHPLTQTNLTIIHHHLSGEQTHLLTAIHDHHISFRLLNFIQHPLWLLVLLICSISIIIILAMMIIRMPKTPPAAHHTTFIILALIAALIVITSAGYSTSVHLNAPPPLDVIASQTPLYSTPGPARVSLWQLPAGTVVQPSTTTKPIQAPLNEPDQTTTFVKIQILQPVPDETTTSTTATAVELSDTTWFPGWIPLEKLMSYQLRQSPTIRPPAMTPAPPATEDS